MDDWKRTRWDNLVELSLLIVSVAVWVFVSPSLMGYMHWTQKAVQLSFYVAFLGALVSFATARASSRIRGILHDSGLAGYLDLLIIAIPLVAIYLLALQGLVSDLPIAGNVLEVITGNPFTLISAWVFSFSLYRTLNKGYEKLTWRVRTGSIGQSVEGSIKLGSNYVKDQLFHATAKLKIQQAKLSQSYAKAETKAQELFKKSVDAWLKHEQGAAAAFANECAETRRIASVLLTAQLALETVIMRLETVGQLGEVAESVLPMARVVQEVHRHLGFILPEVSEELGKINDELVHVIGDTEIVETRNFELFGPNNESQKILSEAELLAKHRMTMSFPDFSPSNLKPLG